MGAGLLNFNQRKEFGKGKAMDVSATVTSKSQDTIPVAPRDRLGVKTGDHLRFFEGTDGTVRVERHAVLSFDDLRWIVKLGQSVTGAEIDRIIAEHRV